MGGCGDELAVRHGVGMNARGNKTRDVSHIYHKISADLVSDLSELCKVDDPRVCRSSGYDHLGLAILCDLEHLVVVDTVSHAVNAVGNEVEVFTRDINGRAVSEVSALVEVHTHYGVAGLEHCEVYGCVCLCARVGLYVCVVCSEKLAGALTRDLLYNVYAFAAAVVALSGVTLGVLVCEVAAHCRHNGGCDDVLARDELEVSSLSFKLVVHCVADGGIVLHKVLKRFDVC